MCNFLILRQGVSLLLLTLGVFCFLPPAHHAEAQPLNPADFSSLGTLDLSGGSFTIDTDALTIVDDAAPGTPLFTGVSDDQGGTADFLNGVWVPASMGIPEIAVFTFDVVDLQSTANITVVGTRALALLSYGDATIDTTIDLSGEDVGFTFAGVPAPAGIGRAGGFSGGFSGIPTVPGDGPGGGDGAILWIAGSGGFGGPGESGFNTGLPGAAYGELVFGPLQGGSGGGSQFENKGGAAGGGALEISAVGSVTLAAGGNLIVAGGDVDASQGFTMSVAGGVGSGGGIRIQGLSVDLLGSIDASASRVLAGGGQSDGGGGRVAVFGSNQLFEFIVGVTNPSSINTSMINVEGGAQNAITRGLISVSPILTTIPSGQSFTLGQVTDLSDASRRLELGHRSNVRVQQGGEAVIPIEGYVNRWKIELFPGDSRILGPGTLDNQGELSGSGTVEAVVDNHAGGTIVAINDVLTFTAVVTNNAGGQITAVNDALTFTQAVNNHAGAQINAINSTLSFGAGLTNNGEMNLINTTVLGSVASSATGNTTLAGSNSVSGDFTMSAADALFVRLGGLLSGQFDTLDVGGDAALAGALNVSLDPGFTLTAGDVFNIVDIAGTAGGIFNGLADDALVGSFGGVDLFIDYDGGDGNDVTLFTVLPGDFDFDSDVDGADFLKWQRGEVSNPPSASDLADWEENFGTVAPLTATSTAVPEPATGIILTLGMAILSIHVRALRYCYCLA